MKKSFTLLLFSSLAFTSFSQLTIQSGATFFIQSGAVVTVQGDVVSNADIQGPGTLLLKGSTLQNLFINGFTIPNLQIDNLSHAALGSAAVIGNSLTFTNGKIQLGNFNLTLANAASTTGGGTSTFVETNGTGQFVKSLNADLASFNMPVGNGTNYTPVSVTTSGTYSGASIGVQAKGTANPNKPVRSTDFLNTSWTINRNGITGSVTGTTTYVDPTNVNGIESDLRGFVWNGTDWSLSGASINTASNQITALVTGTGNDVYAMNRFVFLRGKIFMQGAYVSGTTISGTPVMNDLLRSGTNLIPLTDPYRVAPYNANYAHVNNSVPESVIGTPFANQADARNDIVDWVFAELRNTTVPPGNTILQTRSGLLQRDGDIVDIDGISPLYFKNIDAGSFSVVVRHRTHLGIGTDPASFSKSLNEQQGTVLDISGMTDGQLFGPAAAYTVVNSINCLWSGNANSNPTVRYSGPANDRDYILATVLGGVQGTIINNVYSQGDINMNRGVRYSGPGNDRDYLLTILGGIQGTIRNQVLPN